MGEKVSWPHVRKSSVGAPGPKGMPTESMDEVQVELGVFMFSDSRDTQEFIAHIDLGFTDFRVLGAAREEWCKVEPVTKILTLVVGVLSNRHGGVHHGPG